MSAAGSSRKRSLRSAKPTAMFADTTATKEPENDEEKENEADLIANLPQTLGIDVSPPAEKITGVSSVLSEVTNLIPAIDAPPSPVQSPEKVQDPKSEPVSRSKVDGKPDNAMTKLESLEVRVKESMKKQGIRRSSVAVSGIDSPASKPAEAKDKTAMRPPRSTAADFMAEPAQDVGGTTSTPRLGDARLGLQPATTQSRTLSSTARRQDDPPGHPAGHGLSGREIYRTPRAPYLGDHLRGRKIRPLRTRARVNRAEYRPRGPSMHEGYSLRETPRSESRDVRAASRESRDVNQEQYRENIGGRREIRVVTENPGVELPAAVRRGVDNGASTGTEPSAERAAGDRQEGNGDATTDRPTSVRQPTTKRRRQDDDGEDVEIEDNTQLSKRLRPHDTDSHIINYLNQLRIKEQDDETRQQRTIVLKAQEHLSREKCSAVKGRANYNYVNAAVSGCSGRVSEFVGWESDGECGEGGVVERCSEVERYA